MVALAARSSGRSTEISSQTKITTVMLEPIQEVKIQEQRVGLVNCRSMMRIIARRINAATDRA
jgi:hypothetical protein